MMITVRIEDNKFIVQETDDGETNWSEIPIKDEISVQILDELSPQGCEHDILDLTKALDRDPQLGTDYLPISVQFGGQDEHKFCLSKHIYNVLAVGENYVVFSPPGEYEVQCFCLHDKSLYFYHDFDGEGLGCRVDCDPKPTFNRIKSVFS